MRIVVDRSLPSWVVSLAEDRGEIRTAGDVREIVELVRGPTVLVLGRVEYFLFRRLRRGLADREINSLLFYPVIVGHLLEHPEGEAAINTLLEYAVKWCEEVPRLASGIAPLLKPPRGKVSRRELLRVRGWVTYPESPVNVGGCAGPLAKACHRCADICPSGALTITEAGLIINQVLCDECGLCASICPIGALQTPTFSDWHVKEMPALKPPEDRSSSWGVVFTCDDGLVRISNISLRSGDPVLLPLRVPCVASVGRLAVLTALDSGLDGVVLYCPEDICGLKEAVNRVGKHLAPLGEVSGDLGAFMGLVGGPPERVSSAVRGRRSIVKEPPTPLVMDRRKDIMTLMSKLARKDLDVPGLIYEAEVEPSCTMCGVCVDNCPRGALSIEKRVEETALTFRADLCIGCELCVEVCPEKALKIKEAAFNPKTDYRVAVVENSDSYARCKMCGAVIGPKSMVESIAEKLRKAGLEDAAEDAYLCPNCKAKKALELTTY